MQRIAFVTVTVPVDLEADVPTERRDWWEKAALANFLDHPAVREPHADYLGMFVDSIRFEEPPAAEVE